MRNDKTPFQMEYHCKAENVARSQNLRTRIRLYKALIELEPFKPHVVMTAAGDEKKELAQKLAFIPELKSGWGPGNSDIIAAAEKLAGGYLAHLEVFTSEGFPNPSLAALEALKDYDFEI